MRGKRFEFLKWFNGQYGRRPRKDSLTVRRELADAKAAVTRLEHELEEVVAFDRALQYALYTRNAVEDFYQKKGRK